MQGSDDEAIKFRARLPVQFLYFMLYTFYFLSGKIFRDKEGVTYLVT